MVSSMQSTNNSHDSDSPIAAGQLLQELEALSQALYRTGTSAAAATHQRKPTGPNAAATHQRKPTGKNLSASSRLNETLSRFPSSSQERRAASKPEKVPAEKKTSLWDWRPLRALAHIGRQRLSCEFSLRVHSVEGLPPNLNGVNLCTHWRRRDGGVRTKPARVHHGVVEFEETLYHKCSVYGSRGGPNQGMRYESKFFELSVSLLGIEERELCKHKVDLSRMLPETVVSEDSEDRSGSWTTNFKLTAREGRGGVLVVTLGYKILDRQIGESSSAVNLKNPTTNPRNPNPNALDPKLAKSAVGVGKAYCRGLSLDPLMLGRRGGLDVDLNFDLDLLERMSNLSLDDHNGADAEQLETKNVASLFDFKPTLKFFSEGNVETGHNKGDGRGDGEEENAEFSVIEKGVEMGNLQLENIHEDRGADLKLDEGVEDMGRELRAVGGSGAVRKEIVEPLVAGRIEEEMVDASSIRRGESGKANMLDQTIDSEDSFIVDNKKNGNSQETCSLDDVEDSVAGEFLSMLDFDNKSPVPLSSDSDPESPRASLLKQFEREALLEGDGLGLGVGIAKALEEEPSLSSTREQYGAGVRPGWESDEDLELASIVQVAESELQKAAQTMRSRTRAKILEDAETEALMQEWGMNERAFQNSPPDSTGVFGSPRDLYYDGRAQLPDLAEGFGPLVKIKNGGMLRSMNPALFHHCKNKGNLIMQVSNPVVVPAELGSNVMDILSHLASFGIERLTVEAKKVMPLEDITGKTIQQVAIGTAPCLEGSRNRQPSLQDPEIEKGSDLELVHLADSRRMGFSEYGSTTNIGASKSKLSCMANSYAEYVSLEDLAPQALEKIEALSVEGLKIQSDMADQDAPSAINAVSFGKMSAVEGMSVNKKDSFGLEGTAFLPLIDMKESSSDSDGLLGMTITLDEWMKLDAGIVEEEQASDRTSKILAAHHAVCSDLVVEETLKDEKRDKSRRKHGTRRWGFMGNTLTIALLVQLRDPLRNYEPVGPPMFALIQAERIVVPPRPKVGKRVSESGNSEEIDESEPEGGKKEEVSQSKEEVSQFKITEVHVAGLKPREENKKTSWGNPKQQQSGSRWLLASGMGKSAKHPLLKSKQGAKTMAPSKMKVKPGDSLWSISARINGDGGRWKEVAALNPHIRNPDIIFPNDTIRIR